MAANWLKWLISRDRVAGYYSNDFGTEEYGGNLRQFGRDERRDIGSELLPPSRNQTKNADALHPLSCELQLYFGCMSEISLRGWFPSP